MLRNLKEGTMNRAPTKATRRSVKTCAACCATTKTGTACRAPTKSKSLRRRAVAARRGLVCWRFLGFRIEEPRTGTENLTVRPVLFAKENLALAGVAVEPARDEREVLAEFLACGGHGSDARLGSALRG